MIFSFDIDKQIKRTIAKPDNNKVKHIAWLEVLLSHLKSLWSAFVVYRDTKLRELSYNGQTIILEKALNDSYPAGDNLIYIVNGNGSFEQKYIEYLSENNDDIYGYFLSETPPLEEIGYIQFLSEGTLEYDFTVYIPNTLVVDSSFNMQQFIAFIQKYTIASKTFIVIQYTL